MPKTTVSKTKKMFSAIEKIFSVAEKIFSTTKTMVKIGRRANLHGINRMAIVSDHGLRNGEDVLSLRKDLFDH